MTGKLIITLIIVLGVAPAMADTGCVAPWANPCPFQVACGKTAAPETPAVGAAAAPTATESQTTDRESKLAKCLACGKPALICKCQAAQPAAPAWEAPPAPPPAPEAPPAPAPAPAPEAPPAAAEFQQPAPTSPKNIQSIIDERAKSQPVDVSAIRSQLNPDMQRFMEKIDALRARRAERDAQAAAAAAAKPAPEAPPSGTPK